MTSAENTSYEDDFEKDTSSDSASQQQGRTNDSSSINTSNNDGNSNDTSIKKSDDSYEDDFEKDLSMDESSKNISSSPRKVSLKRNKSFGGVFFSLVFELCMQFHSHQLISDNLHIPNFYINFVIYTLLLLYLLLLLLFFVSLAKISQFSNFSFIKPNVPGILPLKSNHILTSLLLRS